MKSPEKFGVLLLHFLGVRSGKGGSAAERTVGPDRNAIRRDFARASSGQKGAKFLHECALELRDAAHFGVPGLVLRSAVVHGAVYGSLLRPRVFKVSG
jgi:hypothetical protein